jgi:hypothetical protein
MSIYVPGLRGTGDWGADERPKSFRETILWNEPNGSAPLTALMGHASSERVDDPEFAWWEEVQEVARLQLGAAVADGSGTTFTVKAQTVAGTGGLSVIPGEFLMVEDPSGIVGATEIVKVLAVNSDTSITVQRGAQGSTAGAIADNSWLLSIGTGFAEGSGAAAAVTKNPTKFNNYCQIFKTGYEITNTATVTRARTGDPVKNDKKRKMFDHATKMEQAYIFGRMSEGVGANGKPERTTGGILSFLKSNVVNFSGGGVAFTENNFIDAISPVFNYKGEGNSSTRLCFCGNEALTNLNKLARDSASSRITFDSVVELYGMKLQRWILPQGELLIKTHPLFNTHPVYSKSMLGVNMKGLVDRVLRPTKFEDNIQLPGEDIKRGQWLTESGLELHFESTHFYLSNMVA